jgi:hypothetical protein
MKNGDVFKSSRSKSTYRDDRFDFKETIENSVMKRETLMLHHKPEKDKLNLAGEHMNMKDKSLSIIPYESIKTMLQSKAYCDN